MILMPVNLKPLLTCFTKFSYNPPRLLRITDASAVIAASSPPRFPAWPRQVPSKCVFITVGRPATRCSEAGSSPALGRVGCPAVGDLLPGWLEERVRAVEESGKPGVQAILWWHRAVAEPAIFGLPDERWGERPHAFVVLRSGASNLEAWQ